MSYLPKDPAIFIPSKHGVSDADRAAARKRLDEMRERRWRGSLQVALHRDETAERKAIAVELVEKSMSEEEIRAEYRRLRDASVLDPRTFDATVSLHLPDGSPPARWLIEARAVARKNGARR